MIKKFKNNFYSIRKSRQRFFLGCFVVSFFVLILILAFVFIGFNREFNIINAQSAPTNLSMQFSNGEVLVNWNISGDTSVIGYELLYCIGNSSCTLSSRATIAGRTTNSYTFTNVVAGSTYRVQIRSTKKVIGNITGTWNSADLSSRIRNATGGFIDTENNKIWVFNLDDGAYYKSIDQNGVPIGSWSGADGPRSFFEVVGGYVDTENNKIWLFESFDGASYKSIDQNGVPTGSWSNNDDPSGSGTLNGGFIDTANNKIWLFSAGRGAYYKSIDQNGVPTGTWSSAGKPNDSSSIKGGFIDTENNKLWLFDGSDGAYYKSIDQNGVPTGSWSGADKPSNSSSIKGGFIVTKNNTIWLFYGSDGAYYKSIDQNGVPTGSWSSADRSRMIGGFFDKSNNKVWVFHASTLYNISLSVSDAYSSFTDIVDQATLELLAPTNLSFVSDIDSIDITWNINDHASVTGYEIQYCEGVSCSPATSIDITGGSTNSYILTGLTPNTNYRFKMKVVGSIVDSEFTSISNALTDNISIDGLRISTSSLPTLDSITIEWDINSDVDSYTAQYCSSGINCTFSGWIGLQEVGTTAKAIGLNPSKSYKFRVRGINSTLPYETSWYAVTGDTESLESRTNIRTRLIKDKEVVLEWDALLNIGVTSYTIEVCEYTNNSDSSCAEFLNPVSSVNNVATLSGLSPGKKHKFKITANVSQGFVAPSSFYLDNIYTALGQVKNIRLSHETQNDSTIKIVWDTAESAASYKVQYCLVGSECSISSSVGWSSGSIVATNSFSQSGLKKGVEYTFRVKAFNSNYNPSLSQEWGTYDTYIVLNSTCYDSRSSDWTSSTTTTSTNETVSGLTPGKNYAVRVRSKSSTSYYSDWATKYNINLLCNVDSDCGQNQYCSPQTGKCQFDPIVVQFVSELISNVDSSGVCRARVRLVWLSNLTTSNQQSSYEIKITEGADNLSQSDCDANTLYSFSSEHSSSSNSISFSTVDSIEGGTEQNPVNIFLSTSSSTIGQNKLVFGKDYCAIVRINDGTKLSSWSNPILVSSPIKSYPSSSFTHVPISPKIEEVSTIRNISSNIGRTMEYNFYLYERDIATNQYKLAVNASLSIDSSMTNTSNTINNHSLADPLYVRYDRPGKYRIALHAIDQDLKNDAKSGNGVCLNDRDLNIGLSSQYSSPRFQEVPSDFLGVGGV